MTSMWWIKDEFAPGMTWPGMNKQAKTDALQPHSGAALKDTNEGKSSQMGMLQVVHLAIHFTWTKWP